MLEENIFSAGSRVANKKGTYLDLKTEFGSVSLIIEAIAYIQIVKGCCKVYIKDNGAPYVTYSSLNTIIEDLPDYFLQVHPCFIINSCMVQAVQKRKVIIENMHIPVGKVYENCKIEHLT